MTIFAFRGKHVVRSACMGALLFATMGGCGGTTNGDSSDGSGACASWRKAVCDFAARCGGDAATCREQVPSIACSSDALATECATKLGNATCTSAPSGCDLTDLADRDVAQQGCEQFVAAACDYGQRCGQYATADACRADLAASGIVCDAAVGVSPSLDECIDALAMLGCDATESPAVCDTVILVGDLPARPGGTLTSCFALTAEIDTCSTYCARMGQQCSATCGVAEGEPGDFAGVVWTSAGVCPDAAGALAVPTCDSLLTGTEARCCCQ